MKFSIIIPSRTVNDFLKENIRHLKELNYKNFEVILVLDEEDKENIVNDLRFKVIAAGPKGPGEKRNIGAEHASGDILVFLDDDAFPPNDWLNKADKLFNSKEIYALGAPGVTPLNAGFLERCSGQVLKSWLAGAQATCRYTPKDAKWINDYPSVNLFIKKKAFEEVKGFSVDFWPGEDTKLCLDLVKRFGSNFLYDPSPFVYHHRRNLFFPHLKQVSRYGRHRGQFARIYPENSRLISYLIPSLFVSGLVFGFIVSFFNPFVRSVYLSVLFLYIGLLTIEFISSSLEEDNYLIGIYTAIGIFLTHVVYGINFIIGFIKRPVLQLRHVDSKTKNYLGG